jgi:hypothetical protein
MAGDRATAEAITFELLAKYRRKILKRAEQLHRAQPTGGTKP